MCNKLKEAFEWLVLAAGFVAVMLMCLYVNAPAYANVARGFGMFCVLYVIRNLIDCVAPIYKES